jgi:hypothetical protein
MEEQLAAQSAPSLVKLCKVLLRGALETLHTDKLNP